MLVYYFKLHPSSVVLSNRPLFLFVLDLHIIDKFLEGEGTKRFRDLPILA